MSFLDSYLRLPLRSVPLEAGFDGLGGVYRLPVIALLLNSPSALEVAASLCVVCWWLLLSLSFIDEGHPQCLALQRAFNVLCNE